MVNNNHSSSDYLAHHGILGQKWGVRRTDAQLGKKVANHQKELHNKDGETKKGLSDKQKKAIIIGSAVVATALVTYGGYKLKQSGQLDPLINKGKDAVNQLLGKSKKVGSIENISDWKIKDISSKTINGVKKLNTSEALSDTLSKANPLKGTYEGRNNCVPSAIAGFMRQAGYDVTSKSTGGKMQNTAGVVEECFKGAKVLEGSAVTFGKSRQDAAQMLIKRYGQNAEGLCSVDWTTGGGHCFSWKIKSGIVSFFDNQQGYNDSQVSENYFKKIKQNGQLVLARLDGAEIDLDAVKKYVDAR